jgi:archaellum component FlaC
MKRIVKSRLDDHVVDLYNRVDDVKKDISIIKNNHLKHMSSSIYKIEKNVERLIWGLLSAAGALILTLIALVLK